MATDAEVEGLRQRLAEEQARRVVAEQERDGAYLREAAMAGILRLLGESPVARHRVLDAIVSEAARLLGVAQATLFLLVGTDLQLRARARSATARGNCCWRDLCAVRAPAHLQAE